MANSTDAQDWAQLGRYKAANEQLPPIKAGEERVVFIGNSITEAWEIMSPDFFKDHNYINRGIGGQTTGQIKIRFWQDVIKLQATKVIILGGINDIAQNQGFVPIIETVQNMKDMSEMAMDQGIDVIVCSLLPSNYIPWRPSLIPTEAIIELNNLLQSYAIQNDLKYVDYYSEMVNEERGMIEAYTYDGVHCSLEGYKVMERIITPILNE